MTSPDTPLALLAPPSSVEYVAIPKPAIDWLMGTAPDPAGFEFGDFPKGYSRPRGDFWWRSIFRDIVKWYDTPEYPAYVPLPGDPASLSQVPAGQGLSLGQMATTLRGAGMVVTQDHLATPDEKGEPATKGLWHAKRFEEMETAGRLLQKRIKNQRREIRRLLRQETDSRNSFALAQHERSDAMARQAVLQKFIITAGLWNKFCSTLPPLRPHAFPLSPAPEPRNQE